MDAPQSMLSPDYVNFMHDSTSVAVALYEAKELRLLSANAYFESFLLDSWKHGKAVGRPMTDWLPEELSIPIISIFRKTIETGKRYIGEEFPIYHKDYGLKYWNWTLDPICDHDGFVTFLLQTGTDVTKQVKARQKIEQDNASLKKTNKVIRAENKRLELIETVARSVRETLDTASIGKAAVDTIFANFDPICVKIHVVEPTLNALSLVHIQSDENFTQYFRELNLNVSFDSKLLLSRAYKQRTPIIIEDIQLATLAGTIDIAHPLVQIGAASYICVPLWFKDYFEGTLTALFKESITPDGPEVYVLVGCSTHIAAALSHARLHASVENERALLHSTLNQIPEGIMIVDAPDGRISFVNAAAEEITGISGTAQLGLVPAQHPLAGTLTDPDQRPISAENFTIMKALRGETTRNHEEIVTRADGRKITLLVTSAPIFNEDGIITGGVFVFQDISERKSVEQAKNNFLSIASHELRTPITAIQGFAEIINMQSKQTQIPGNPRFLRAINGISEQSKRLTTLIEEMLDLSRIEHERLRLNTTRCNLITLLTHIIDTQSITSKQHTIRLVLEGVSTSDELIGYFDENRIVQVFNNLIDNAIKYSPAGGEIEVGLHHLQHRPSEVLIWVKDQGIGIPIDEIPYIFERFHRASNLDRSISGLGIGLYLVKELVSRHGGRIWAENNEMKGSTFFVQLPLQLEP